MTDHVNLLPNPGFEDQSFPALSNLAAGGGEIINGETIYYYSPSDDPGVQFSDAQHHSGARSLRVVGWRSIPLTQDRFGSSFFACSPGQKFYVEIYAARIDGYIESLGNHCSLQVMWLDTAAPTYLERRALDVSGVSYNYLSTTIAAVAPVEYQTGGLDPAYTGGWPNGQWVKLSGWVEAPAGAYGFQLMIAQIQVRDPLAGEVGGQEVPNVFYWDDPFMCVVSDEEYAAVTLSGAAPPSVAEIPVVPPDEFPVDVVRTDPVAWTGDTTPLGYPSDKAIPAGAVTVPPDGEEPDGYYSLSQFAAKSGDDWLNPIHLRETKRWKPFGRFLNSLLDAILGLPSGTSVGATLQTVFTALTGMRDHVNESFRSAQQAKIANKAADLVTDFKSAAGSNLVLSPAFSSSSISRFILDEDQFSGYTTAEHHSGVQCWVWHHLSGTDTGFVMAPTVRINHIDVAGGEVYFAEAWIKPNDDTVTETGSIRIGVTYTDTSGGELDASVYGDYPLDGPDMVPGVWNKINIEVTVPEFYNQARFWVRSTAATEANSVFYLDDVVLRENTKTAAAKKQADWAEFVTDARARAGSNLVIDPKFSNRLIPRFPFNDDQVYDYSNTQAHSGVLSWKWTQETSAACGLILNPTAKYDSYQVADEEEYGLSAWMYWPSTNSGSAGSVRIGGTFTDSSGVLSPQDVYSDYPIVDIVSNTWTKVTATTPVPSGYDTAKFWVIATSGVTAGNVLYVDDVELKDTTGPQGIIDRISEAVGGLGKGNGNGLLSVFNNIRGIKLSADNANIGVEKLRAQLSGGGWDEFDYEDANALPSSLYEVSYSGPGAGNYGPNGDGYLVWKPSGVSAREVLCRRTDTTLAEDNGVVTVVWASTPHAAVLTKTYGYIMCRCSLTSNDTHVRAEISDSNAKLFAVVGGSKTQLGSTVNLDINAGDVWELWFGHADHARRFWLKQNGVTVLTAEDGAADGTGSVSEMAAGFRQVGIGCYVNNYLVLFQNPAPSLAGWTWALQPTGGS